MAVGPNDLLVLSQDDILTIDRLESLIDEKLSANYEPGGRVAINLTQLGEFIKHKVTFKMKKELFVRYEKVGWTLNLDGSGIQEFMIFQGPRPKTEAEKDQVVPDLSVDQMLEKMKEKVISGESSGVKPPVVKQASREDPELPYNRTRLASKP